MLENGQEVMHSFLESKGKNVDSPLIRETYWKSFTVLQALIEVQNLKELGNFREAMLKNYVEFMDKKWGVKLPWTEGEVSELSVTIRLATDWKEKAMKAGNDNIEELREYYYNIKLFLEYLLQRLWINERSDE